jgi:YHS domain-containing protein
MRSLSRLTLTLRRAAALVILTAVAASSALAQQGHTAQNVDDNGLILSGYDAVAYQTQAKAVRGSALFTATHDGAIYRFASAENRDAFKAAPAKYAPAYGGYCAMGVAMGKKLPVDPTAFTVANGKLFLNVNKDVQGMFAKDVASNDAMARKNWAAVSARNGYDKM